MRPLRTSAIEAVDPKDPTSAYSRLTPEKPEVGLTMPKLPGRSYSSAETITLEEYRRQEAEGELIPEVEFRAKRGPR